MVEKTTSETKTFVEESAVTVCTRCERVFQGTLPADHECKENK